MCCTPAGILIYLILAQMASRFSLGLVKQHLEQFALAGYAWMGLCRCFMEQKLILWAEANARLSIGFGVCCQARGA